MKREDITPKLRERFCRDCNIPIKLFEEPYFSERMELLDRFYGTLEKWELFVKCLEPYQNDQDYLTEYSSVKDRAIQNIKESIEYNRFNCVNMNAYAVRPQHMGLPSKDIFKPSNDGKTFVSIDMKKANFSALQHYDKNMFKMPNGEPAETWEQFMSQFTDNEHIIRSKYIRQVILGNCNPRRHITYEKYIMDMVLGAIDSGVLTLDNVEFFSNDEIVFDITDKQFGVENINSIRENLARSIEVPLKVELFTIHKIGGTDGFYKRIKEVDGSEQIEFKCLDSYKIPFVLRKISGQEIRESDKVFYHEGLLAKFIEIPNIEI